MGATFWKGIYTKLITPGGIEFQDGRLKTQGSGSPEGVVTASVGSEYTDTSTGVLYLKQSGSGNTGWGANVNPALKDIIDYSKPMGEIFFLPDEKATNFTYDPLNPRDYFPAVNLAAIEFRENFTSSTLPLTFIQYMAGVLLKYLPGRSGEVSSWAVTVSGDVVTFPNTVSANTILAALVEDDTVNGHSNSINRGLGIDGNTYFVSSGTVNLVARTVQLTSSPVSQGSQTAVWYAYRNGNTNSTIQLFSLSGEALMAPNDPDGYFIANLRTRGYLQGHWHENEVRSGYNSGTPIVSLSGQDTLSLLQGNLVKDPITDGTNGPPLTRKITHGPAYTLIPYMWCGG